MSRDRVIGDYVIGCSRRVYFATKDEPNANFDGLRMGDYFEGFVNEEARNLGKTLSEIKAWVPPMKAAKAPKAKKTRKNAAQSGVEPEG